ncbi:MAG: MmgE/PrpD family protein [Candidatus Dormibacteria bacterium]
MAQQFAEFILDLSYEQVPEAVAAAGKLHALDAIGCGLASLAAGSCTAALRVAEESGGTPASTAIGCQQLLPAPAAALANGMLCHGLDYDDTHTASGTHVSVAVVPAALASAEATGAHGREALTAMVAGMEFVTRLGMAAPFAFHQRGFHPTSVCGIFGATAAAARLQGLDSATTVNAIGIAGSMASGLFAYLTDGSQTKPIHPGWAAHSGIMATRLAANGATGPAAVFEGRFGLFPAFTGNDHAPLEEQFADLGTRWETPRIAFKPFPACHFVHACLEALAEVMVDPDFDANDLGEIVTLVPADAVPLVLEPVSAKLAPRTGYDAKFSLQYALGAMLVDGRVDVATYAEDRITDPRILGIARHVTYRVVDFPTYPAAFPGGVIVTTKSGRRFEVEVPYQRGDEHNPMSEADVREKFRANALMALDPELAAAQADALLHLEEFDDLRGALHALTRARGGGLSSGVASARSHLQNLSPASQIPTSRVLP